jgi:Putative helicase
VSLKVTIKNTEMINDLISNMGIFKRRAFKSRLLNIERTPPRREPIKKTGIPLHSPESLLKTQEEVVSKLKLISHVSSNTFDSLYMTVIKKYCEYVHQIPASENHHHAKVGGLLRHGLEVSAGAYRRSHNMLFSSQCGVELRRVREPAYQYASFLSGLLHDTGKAAYDVEVTNNDHSLTWDPFVESLYDWAIKNHIDEYYVHYVRSRQHRKHELISAIVIPQILPKSTLSYLHGVDREILPLLYGCISGIDQKETNPFIEIIEASDGESVKLNLQGSLDLEGTSFQGVSIPEHFVNTVRFLLKGALRPNRDGSKILYSSGDAYILYPAGIATVIDWLEKDGVPGIPKDIDVFVDKLVDYGVLSVRKNPVGVDTPRFNIEYSSKGETTIKVVALKLSNAKSVFRSQPAKIITLTDVDSPLNSGADTEMDNLSKASTSTENSFENIAELFASDNTIAGTFLSLVAYDLLKKDAQIVEYCFNNNGSLVVLPKLIGYLQFDEAAVTKSLLDSEVSQQITCVDNSLITSVMVDDDTIEAIEFTKEFSKNFDMSSLSTLSDYNNRTKSMDDVVSNSGASTPENNGARDKESLHEKSDILSFLKSVYLEMSSANPEFDIRATETIMCFDSNKALRWYMSSGNKDIDRKAFEKNFLAYDGLTEVPEGIKNGMRSKWIVGVILESIKNVV